VNTNQDLVNDYNLIYSSISATYQLGLNISYDTNIGCLTWKSNVYHASIVIGIKPIRYVPFKFNGHRITILN